MESDEIHTRESAYRMNDLTWRNCYEWGYVHLVDLDEAEQAIRYIEAWCSFDPNSPLAYYWLALAYAKSKLEQEALKALDNAAENGFSDAATVENASYFDNLRSCDEYSAIIQKMKK